MIKEVRYKYCIDKAIDFLLENEINSFPFDCDIIILVVMMVILFLMVEITQLLIMIKKHIGMSQYQKEYILQNCMK